MFEDAEFNTGFEGLSRLAKGERPKAG